MLRVSTRIYFPDSHSVYTAVRSAKGFFVAVDGSDWIVSVGKLKTFLKLFAVFTEGSRFVVSGGTIEFL